jgi:predicted CXXCH cytochrome family protein
LNQNKKRKRSKREMKKTLIALFVVLAAMVMVYGVADAKVSGECVNCHTMHNSQDGEPMAVVNGAWDGGPLSGMDAEMAFPGLLRAGCISCHSSDNDETIHVAGSSDIPIVRTTVPPSATLAGGNFYWAENGMATGHNVTEDDGILLYGPGLPLDFGGLDPAIPGSHGHCAGSCHNKLHNPIRSGAAIEGCRGCHFETFHHADPGPFPGGVTNTVPPKLISGDYSVDPTYRFLTGHHYWGRISGGVVVTAPGVYVEGVEDSDWEDTVSASDHNVYQGNNTGVAGIVNSVNRSISAFCAACHEHFYTETEHGGWVRHPVDENLPTAGEYAAYDYMTAYSPEAPVAFEDADAPAAGEGQVSCVSCHRPHGTPNDDMLRWDYTTMIAAGGGSGGCFTCHTTKDNP